MTFDPNINLNEVPNNLQSGDTLIGLRAGDPCLFYSPLGRVSAVHLSDTTPYQVDTYNRTYAVTTDPGITGEIALAGHTHGAGLTLFMPTDCEVGITAPDGSVIVARSVSAERFLFRGPCAFVTLLCIAMQWYVVDGFSQ